MGMAFKPIFGISAAISVFATVFLPIVAAPHEVTAGTVIPIGFHAQAFLA